MRVTLPGEDQWVELVDPEDITRKHIRKARLGYGKGETLSERMESGREEVLTIIIKNWTLEQPIPSQSSDPVLVLDSLPRATWYALEKAADSYLEHFGDPSLAVADGKPADPQVPSQS